MSNKLTPEDLKQVHALQKKYMNKHKELRKGQAFFNALHWVSPSVADSIRNTGADPFYTDDNLEECLKQIT